tara:strand:+ start:856 stop:1323 length:468 start_codon:yes stop_codon:yes gene_type:complete
MIKNFILLVLFTFTLSCGFEAVYSKKNIIKNRDFSISKITTSGDRNLNIKIERKFKNYSSEGKDKIYTLKIISETLKTVIAKNAKGDATIYKLNINVNILANNQNNEELNIQFSKNFKYNNNEDKIELKRYEEEIKENLADSITQDLIFRLANNQ